MILLVNVSLAITPKQRTGLNEFLDGIGDDRTKFQIFMSFADDQGYDFSDEEQLKNKIEANAHNFGVLLFPYEDIKGINTDKVDAKTIKTMEAAGIEIELPGIREKIGLGEMGGFWLVFFMLVSLIIIISALEFYRRNKIKQKQKRKKK